MLADQDTRIAEPQGMQQEMQQLFADFNAEASYIEPEILRLGARHGGALPRRRAAAEAVHRSTCATSLRRAPHTLSDAEEKILADAGPLAGSASNIYGILSNADFPYPTITLSDGRQVKVNQAGYAELRTLPDRDDRRTAMSAFFSALGGFSRTFGTTMNASVQKASFFATSRRYASNLEMALDGPNIPVSVYTRLIDGVNRHLPTFHRYLRLRKRMMGLTDALHYYDLYAPLVADVNLRYTPEEAEAHVLAAVAPLGSDYVVGGAARVCRAAGSTSIRPPGKRSGAYSNGGAYDVHPYMLLNYLGQYNDVSTLAHELGHTMHSYYSNKTQPFPTAGYQTFVAEVASTFNEALLIDHMLRQIKDDATRLSLLGNYLENVKSTVFRQTQFAEFELRMHEAAQKGAAITGDMLVEALRRHHAPLLRPRPGHLHRRRLRRARVELHAPLLPRLLRVPVRHLVHRGRGAVGEGARRRPGGDEAVSDVPLVGRFEVPDRPAEGRRRRHDDRRAARPHGPEDGRVMDEMEKILG